MKPKWYPVPIYMRPGNVARMPKGVRYVRVRQTATVYKARVIWLPDR